MKKILLTYIFSLLTTLCLLGQGAGSLTGQNQNYVVKTTVNVRGILDEASIPAVAGPTTQTVIYSDDLGRPIQTVATQGSPSQKDLVKFSEYDPIGRSTINYLGYTSTSTDGRYKATPVADVLSFYGNTSASHGYDVSPFSVTKFSESPLGRIKEQGGVGDAWQPDDVNAANGKTQKYSYTTNTGSDQVIKWTITSDDNSFAASMTASYYPVNTLRVSIVQNDAHPDHVLSKTYQDHFGNTVLTKTQVNSTEWSETYYVYDKRGQLRMVLPPALVKNLKTNNVTSIDEVPAGYELIEEDRSILSYTGVSYLYVPGVKVTLPPTYTWSPTFSVKPYNSNASLLGQYAYQYLYDKRGRQIASKFPGQDWSYFVYDNDDQLILTQNGLQRAKEEWSFSKYDIHSRIILAGTVKLTGSLAVVQEAANAYSTTFETKGSAVLGYTNSTYPNVVDENNYHVAKYYDNIHTVSGAYSGHISEALNFPEITNEILADFSSEMAYLTKNFLVHEKARVLGSDHWIETSYFHDRYQRNVFTSTKEIGPNGTDWKLATANVYEDFTNIPVKQRTKAFLGNESVSFVKRFEYDQTGRLLREFESTTDLLETLTVSYSYNELGQLVDKKLHSEDNGSTFLQSIDFAYNIKGSVLSVNSLIGNANETDYFGSQLTFNQSITGASNTLRYDGMLSAFRWRDDLTQEENLYNYSYDYQNQLTTATYKKKGSGGVWGDNNKYSEYGMAYDENGNILSLSRNQGLGTSPAIDQLNYDYGSSGNQLLAVSDNASGDGKAKGFNDGNSGTDYTYDKNGNLIADKNKGITSITYNFLSLPDQIRFSDGSRIEITYDSYGTRLRYTVFKPNGEQELRNDYIGRFLATDGIFHSILTEQGRIVSPSYANLIANKDAGSLEGFSPTASVALSAYYYAPGDQNYVKVQSQAATTKVGVSISGALSVKPGQRYAFKVLGYAETAQAAYLCVKSGNTEIAWEQVQLPQGQLNENYVTQEFVVPAGVTSVTLHVLWAASSQNSVFYLNYVGLHAIDWEHQYLIADHLGSTRVVLGTRPSTLLYTATFETENATDEANRFENIDQTRVVNNIAANATPGGNEVITLDKNYKVGPAKSFQVFPGDKINASVNAYYLQIGTGQTSAAIMAASVVSAMTGVVTGIDAAVTNAYSYSESGYFGFTLSTSQTDRPSAYLNYILFDENKNPIKAHSVPVGSNANTRQLIQSPQIAVEKRGYLFVYLSYDNDSDIPVYFDDFKINYEESPLLQVNGYYPYGMTSYSWTRPGEHGNRYLYQGKEIDGKTGWHDFHARQYDASLGRWFAVDPKGQFSSPYNALGNNPIMVVDPDGQWAGWDDAIVAGTGFVYGYVSYGLKHDDWGKKALLNGAINAVMFELGYLSAGGLNPATGQCALLVDSAPAWVPYLATSAANIAASQAIPAIPIYQNDNVTISAQPTFTMQGLGASVNASYTEGDWTVGSSMGITGTQSGFESRVGGGVTYFDGTSGGSVGITHFGGSYPQNNWIASYKYKEASLTLTNDVWVGGDKWRTAAGEIGWKEYSVGFSVFTNEATPISEENPADLEYRSKAVGANNKGKGTYPDGHRITSPLYVGYRQNGVSYRAGIDAPFVQDYTQNAFHKLIGSPFFKSGYGDGARPYFFMRSFDPYSLY